MGIGTPASHRIWPGLAALAMWLAVALPHDALASGDYGCDLHWSLKRRTLDPCNNVPFLSPANDSRVNLVLLLADRGRIGFSAGQTASWQVDHGLVPFGLAALHEWEVSGQRDQGDGTAADRQVAAGARPSFARGEGNRCRTNTDDAVRAFVAQVTASAEVPDAEQKELERSRRALLGACSWNEYTRSV